MKINILTPAILLIFSALIFTSCTANALPKVKNATYEAYDISGEKGYLVAFELTDDAIPPSSVVINRIQQTVSFENKAGLKYNVNVLSQSRKILGFKAKITNHENGIFFKTDSAEVFQPVDFELQTR